MAKLCTKFKLPTKTETSQQNYFGGWVVDGWWVFGGWLAVGIESNVSVHLWSKPQDQDFDVDLGLSFTI